MNTSNRYILYRVSLHFVSYINFVSCISQFCIVYLSILYHVSLNFVSYISQFCIMYLSILYHISLNFVSYISQFCIIYLSILSSITGFLNRALYYILWENIAEPTRPQMTIRILRIACWMPDYYKDALGICNTYCFSIASIVARTRLNVTLNVLWSVSCFLPSGFHQCICPLPYFLLLPLSHVMSIKVKCTLVQELSLCTGCTAHRGSRGIALPFHDHGTRRGWVVSVTPRPLFIPGKDPVPIVQEAGWTPGPVWTGAQNSPPPRFGSRTVQPVASRYTYWATRPTVTSVDPSKYVFGVLYHLAKEYIVWNRVGLFVHLPLGDLVSATEL
jgi:hypothetical protein